MQKTNFPFEILIYDDASTDGTATIIKEYAVRYPDIIKPVISKINYFSRKIHPNKRFNWGRIQGKYVALCEGDDYWTDPYKLQRQVDFLDSHSEYSMCFHPVCIHWEDERNRPDEYFPREDYRFYKTTLGLADLLKHNFIQTNSVMYRWSLYDELAELFPENIIPDDWFLHLLYAQKGKIGFLPQVMAVYRKHKNGIWFNCYSEEWFQRFLFPMLNFYLQAEQQFASDQILHLAELMSRVIDVCKETGDFGLLKRTIQTFPKLWARLTSKALRQSFPVWAGAVYKLSLPKFRSQRREYFKLLRNLWQIKHFLKKNPEYISKKIL